MTGVKLASELHLGLNFWSPMSTESEDTKMYGGRDSNQTYVLITLITSLSRFNNSE